MNYMIQLLVCRIQQCTTVYQTIGISHRASVTLGVLDICLTRTALRQLHFSTVSQISPKLATAKDTKGALCNIYYVNINSISTTKITSFRIFIPDYFK